MYFNATNTKTMLHNISVLCPIISPYISNCYNTPACLFIIGGTEILWKEGTKQGDPTAVAAYALGVTLLIQHFLEMTSSKKPYSNETKYADDFAVAGSIKETKCYWEHLNSFALFFGYFPKASKSHVTVKGQYLEITNVVFGNTKLNLTLKGMGHLGTVIGNHLYKEKYVSELVTNLNDQLQLLSKKAETQP